MNGFLALTKEQIEQLGFSAMEIVFDCGCFAETSKKTVLGPPLAVKTKQHQVKDLQLMQSARELRCNLGGQSNIYLRPIQRNLSTKSLIPQNYYEVKERCIS